MVDCRSTVHGNSSNEVRSKSQEDESRISMKSDKEFTQILLLRAKHPVKVHVWARISLQGAQAFAFLKDP